MNGPKSVPSKETHELTKMLRHAKKDHGAVITHSMVYNLAEPYKVVNAWHDLQHRFYRLGHSHA